MQGRNSVSFIWRSLALVAFSSSVLAGGVQLPVVGSGSAYANAGVAALTDDASSLYYNPAIASANRQVNMGFSAGAVDNSTDVKIYFAQNNFAPNAGDLNPTIGNDRESIGGWFPLYGAYFSMPLRYGLSTGLSITAPWGIDQNYTASARSRYLAQYTALHVFDVAPVLSYHTGCGLSLGIGMDALYTSATMTQALPFISTDFKDARLKNEGDGWAFGWNIGALWQFACGTTVGLSFHSEVTSTPRGKSSYNPPESGPVAPINDTNRADILYPEFADFSVVHAFSDRWKVLATVQYTNWSAVSNFQITYSGPLAPVVGNQSLVALNWKDTFSYSLGASFQPNDCWKLKAGFNYDESPESSKHSRRFFVPINNLYRYSAGVEYAVSSNLRIDATYTFTTGADTKINERRVTPTSGADLVTEARADCDMSSNAFMLQFNWRLGAEYQAPHVTSPSVLPSYQRHLS